MSNLSSSVINISVSAVEQQNKTMEQNGTGLETTATPVNTNQPFTSYVANQNLTFHENVPTSAKGKSLQRANASPSLDEILALRPTGMSKKLKHFLRKCDWSVDQPQRKMVWWQVFQIRIPRYTSVYENLSKDVYMYETGAELGELPEFVDDGMACQYFLNEEGVNTSKKIVHVLAKARPDVIWAPYLHPVCSLLLHYLTEQQVFDIAEGLLLNSHSKHLCQTRSGHTAAAGVLVQLLHKHMKSAHTLLSADEADIERIFINWASWIFECLPFPHLVRVLDCYLMEGQKVLYRVALAILKLYCKKRMRQPLGEKETLGQSIAKFCKEMPGVSPSLLLKTSFELRNFSRKAIQQVTHAIELEMKERSLARADEAGGLKRSRSFLKRIKSSHSFHQLVVSRSFSAHELSSHVLPEREWMTVWSWLPQRACLYAPEMLFSTETDGTTLSRLFTKIENRPNFEATIFLIKTTKGESFGCYCATDWVHRRHIDVQHYFGTGESFVFTIYPHLQCYPWVGLGAHGDVPATSHLFQSSTESCFMFGGGGGVAIQLDSTLDHGRTLPCTTFNNPPLCSQQDFHCATLEVFGFK